MGQEIARLEAELSRVEDERKLARDALTKAGEEPERAKAESTTRTLQAELTELRVESRQELTAWVERASRAEALLRQYAKFRSDLSALTDRCAEKFKFSETKLMA